MDISGTTHSDYLLVEVNSPDQKGIMKAGLKSNTPLRELKFICKKKEGRSLFTLFYLFPLSLLQIEVLVMSGEGLATGSTSEGPVRDDEEEPNVHRSHSAGEQRKFKGRGANKWSFNSKNRNDRQWSSTPGRRHPGTRHEERVQHNHDEKDKDLINWINNEIDKEQGACHLDSTSSMGKPEHKSIGAGDDDHTSTKQTAESTGTRQKTRAFKGQISRRNYYPHDTRRLHGQSKTTRSDHDSSNCDDQEMQSSLTMQKRQTSQSMVANKINFSSSSRQPPENYMYSEYYRESNKPINRARSRQKLLKGEAAAAKGKKRDYKSQKEDVLRTLSHLNPVQSSQASVLIEQLRNETYECMVCCERVRCSAAVWSCQSCHHLFHLGCVRKWAKSSSATAATQGMILLYNKVL